MADYQLTSGSTVVRTRDGAAIPDDPQNRDRIEYNKWLADGGVPDPYVAPPTPPQPPPLVVIWADQYMIKAAPGADPSPGKISFDTAGQTDARTLYMSRVSGANSDMTTMMSSAAQPGRLVRVELRNDATSFMSFNVRLAPVILAAPGPALAIAIELIDSHNAPFSNNAQVTVAVYKP